MANPVQAIQGVNPLVQTQQTTPPAKTQQPTTQSATPQDKVTISPQAQTLAANAKSAAGGEVDHDGDNH